VPGQCRRHHHHDAATAFSDADREAVRRLRPDLKLILGGPPVTLVHSAKKLETKRSIRPRSPLCGVARSPVRRACSGDGELAIFEALKEYAPKLIDGDDPKGGLFLTDQMLPMGRCQRAIWSI
jgi:anaerobic magnesium-protoporphyrin IX monomethyl ester cyclase